jgi:hypothetical protein
MPSCDVLLRGDASVRAKHVAALQRLVGNRWVSQFLEPLSREQTPATAVAYGSIGGLHGRTESTPDGGKRAITDLKTSVATSCSCPVAQKCLEATATAVVTFTTSVTITMPPMPSGLNACERAKVEAFFKNVLRPHEEEHKRRFKTYEGTVRQPIQTRGCGLTEVKNDLDSKAQEIQDKEHTARDDAARKLSDAIDPFFRVVDTDDCAP